MNKKLCSKCILPDNYVGISFDDDNTCNFCKERIKNNFPEYQGKDVLKEDINNILKHHPNRKYDCVVGFSGGRDSTFMLWYIVTQLNIKPLAVFIDSGLIPEQTIQNIKETVNILNVDLKIVRHSYLKNTFPYHFKSWLKNPVPETLITFCVGCRLGIHKFVDEEAIKQNIPILFYGGTPFEGKHYKINILKTDPTGKKDISFIMGYLRQVIQNPSLVLNPYCLIIQLKEYGTVKFQRKKIKQHGIHIINFFYQYIRWEEKLIENTLKEKLNWERYPGLTTSYRGDCEIGIIRQFLYFKLLGYNDKDDHLSCLIRDNQISREEAINRICGQHNISVEMLKKTCKKAGIEYSKLEEIIKNYER